MCGRPRATILHVIGTLSGGGTERMLLRLLERLDHARHRHVVVTLRQAGPLAALLPAEVPCVAFGANGKRRLLGRALAAVARDHDVVVIHARNTNTWADATLAKLLVPRVAFLLGFHGLDHAGRFTRRDRLVVAAARRLKTRFATVASAGRRRLERELAIPENRIVTIPNGIDLSRFEPPDETARSKARASFGLEPDAFVVGTVASLTRVKRQDVLIDAFAAAVRRDPILRLLLVGDGPLREPLWARCRDHGLADKVIMPGRLDDPERALAAMDAYVCSSDSECFNNAVLEAAACGLPIVATDVGDNAAVIRPDREGLIVAAGDVEGLAHAIAALAADVDVRARLSRAAGRRALDFDLKNTVSSYESLYAAMAGACRDRARPTSRHRLAPCYS